MGSACVRNECCKIYLHYGSKHQPPLKSSLVRHAALAREVNMKEMVRRYVSNREGAHVFTICP